MLTYFSRNARHSRQMLKHVHKILSAQRDILSAEAIRNVENAMRELQDALRAKAQPNALEPKMTGLEAAANKWLKSYPNPGLRENVEVLLVAIAVAMGIRTFFVQPFKIPTGSMQPTLYGITSTPDTSKSELNTEDFKIPNSFAAFFEFWFSGVSYTHRVAKADGVLNLEASDQGPRKFLLFNLKQTIVVGNEAYTIWFPPDDMLRRGGLYPGKQFKAGEDIIKLRVVSGDHLFVDRFTYNFRHPKLGEIIVFETTGIPGLPPDQFYIKRLVALSGNHVRILNDRHLVLDGKRLDSSTPHFEHVYSFATNAPARESTYSGHVNDVIARDHGFGPNQLARNFPDENTEFVVRPNHYMVMGDNTLNSSDSRTWGDFPQEKVIGRSFFVYWPIGAQDGRASRFGWGHR